NIAHSVTLPRYST
ncbi:MAG: hypothetical protein EZS28_042289, partial [Streblomastix strix]